MNVITAEKLTKTYNYIKAIDSISFITEKGESVALIGANGSGKTTLINILLGLTAPDAPPEGGQSFLLEYNSRNLAISAKQRIGYISNESTPMPWVKLYDLQSFFRHVYEKWDDTTFTALLDKWGLEADKRMCDMSQGQQRLAEFALITSYAPSILFLDEPFLGLDPINRHAIAELLNNYRKEHEITLFYSTHVLSEIPRLAKRVIILKEGKIQMDMPLASFTKSIDETFLEINNITHD